MNGMHGAAYIKFPYDPPAAETAFVELEMHFSDPGSNHSLTRIHPGLSERF